MLFSVSVFRENQLLSACNANNAENAGVRCANANNRGANTNANYGFPLYMPLLCFISLCILLPRPTN